jgi:hypothetical protein
MISIPQIDLETDWHFYVTCFGILISVNLLVTQFLSAFVFLTSNIIDSVREYFNSIYFENNQKINSRTDELASGNKNYLNYQQIHGKIQNQKNANILLS